MGTMPEVTRGGEVGFSKQKCRLLNICEISSSQELLTKESVPNFKVKYGVLK